MATNPAAESLTNQPATGLQSSRVYQLCVAAIVVGLAIGYFVVGVRKTPAPVRTSVGVSKPGMMPGGHPVPTMEQMKAMADVKAPPLLEKLKGDPKNAKLLAQVAALYNSTHQFKDAANYYNRALQVDSKNVTTRTDLASNLYYQGDTDGAIRELQKALKYSPNDVNALFNLGMIKFKGKDDAAGAIAVWQQLMKAHPDLDRKPVVEQMIEEAKQKIAAKK
ncbi:MAG TPA: tetratricopeptide repeat protein [Candidatus Acidoferrum sp.]|jgi:cytochrome c-type biogenesis protein CcmH/NrfG